MHDVDFETETLQPVSAFKPQQAATDYRRSTLLNEKDRVGCEQSSRTLRPLRSRGIPRHCGAEKFGETASSRQERQFSGVLRIAQSPAHGAISLIASENPQRSRLRGGEGRI